MSPGRISSILKKSNGEEETKLVSKDTQVKDYSLRAKPLWMYRMNWIWV